MLFVKNTMFLNSATAILAPDLDMLQQMMAIYTYFAETHGERILREVGIDASQAAPDPDAMKAAFLVDSDDRHAHVPRPPGAARRGAAQAAAPARPAASRAPARRPGRGKG